MNHEAMQDLCALLEVVLDGEAMQDLCALLGERIDRAAELQAAATIFAAFIVDEREQSWAMREAIRNVRALRDALKK